MRIRQAKAEKTAAALAEAGEDEGDPNVPYAEWTAKQLKAEVAKRNAQEDRADEDQIDIAGLKKKSEIAKLLDEDDEANADSDDSDDSGDSGDNDEE